MKIDKWIACEVRIWIKWMIFHRATNEVVSHVRNIQHFNGFWFGARCALLWLMTSFKLIVLNRMTFIFAMENQFAMIIQMCTRYAGISLFPIAYCLLHMAHVSCFMWDVGIWLSSHKWHLIENEKFAIPFAYLYFLIIFRIIHRDRIININFEVRCAGKAPQIRCHFLCQWWSSLADIRIFLTLV